MGRKRKKPVDSGKMRSQDGYKARHRSRLRKSGKYEQLLNMPFEGDFPMLRGMASASITIDEETLRGAMTNPATGMSNIVQVSREMKRINGVYNSAIRYYSTLLTFDHYIYPNLEHVFTGEFDVETERANAREAALHVSKYKLKKNLPEFAARIMTSGAVFLYKIESPDSVGFFELSVDDCRISYMEDSVYRFQFNLESITEDNVLSYPESLQSIWETYSTNPERLGEELVDDSWYQIDHNGVAFTLDEDVLTQDGIAMPPFAMALLDALRAEQAKDNMEDLERMENMKLIHSKIKTDDNGDILIDHDMIREFRALIEGSLPEGVTALLTPFETDSITLTGKNVGREGRFALAEKFTDNIFQGVGVNSMLFSEGGASGEALRASVKVDCQWLYSRMLPMFEAYMNYELRQASALGLWHLRFVEVSWMFRDEAISQIENSLTLGGASRQKYLAALGMTPIEAMNLMVFEQDILDIDSYMVVRPTAHNMSSNAGNNEGGRPTTGSPSDTTDRIRNTQ